MAYVKGVGKLRHADTIDGQIFLEEISKFRDKKQDKQKNVDYELHLIQQFRKVNKFELN